MKRLILIAAVMMAAAACSGKGPDGFRSGDLVLLSESAVATVYNAVPAQCGDDCLHTASMFEIDPSKVSGYRILAMERTMMARCGVAYGDQVYVEGAGRYDGLWTVEDTMNRRFAGQDRIDFLVPEETRTGRWKDVRVYKVDRSRRRR
jgi:hypothetical protein